MPTPELKQFEDLTLADFARHPVWIACHCEDYGEPWYDDTDEETFRPWLKALPIGPSDGMFLVKTIMTFRDGTTHEGFVTPSHDPDDLGIMQPHVFLSRHVHGFWGGMFGIPQEARQSFYLDAGKTAADIFPISFEPSPGLAKVHSSGTIAGFYSFPQDKVIVET